MGQAKKKKDAAVKAVATLDLSIFINPEVREAVRALMILKGVKG